MIAPLSPYSPILLMIIELEDGFTNYDQAVEVAKIYEKDYNGVNVEEY